MLLTRCPSCTTAFRITAELLKQASGQVRCGRCNHVFPAFAHLEEADAEPDAHGIGRYSPEADDGLFEAPADTATGLADELAETSEYEALASPGGEDIVTKPASDVEPVTADELVEIFDGDPAKEGAAGGETMATENRVLLATIDPEQPLDFELPPDEWQAFYEAEV